MLTAYVVGFIWIDVDSPAGAFSHIVPSGRVSLWVLINLLRVSRRQTFRTFQEVGIVQAASRASLDCSGAKWSIDTCRF